MYCDDLLGIYSHNNKANAVAACDPTVGQDIVLQIIPV
jgi:hypothetical protein